MTDADDHGRRLDALRWYFSSAATMALYQLDRSTLLRLGMEPARVDSIEKLGTLVDKEATLLIGLAECVYKNLCGTFTAIEAKRKPRLRWFFEFPVLRGKKKNAGKLKKAYVGGYLDVDIHMRPALLLWLQVPRLDAFAPVRRKLEEDYDEAQAWRLWGDDGKEHFIIGTVTLGKQGGGFKSAGEVTDEMAEVIQATLLKQGQYCVLRRLADCAYEP